MLAVIGFVIGVVALALIPVAGIFWGDAFPGDARQRMALEACAQADPGFNRLVAAARRACYDRGIELRPAKPAAAPANASKRLIDAG